MNKIENTDMTRRLFFLLPDIEHTKRVVEDLMTNKVDKRHMHVIARDDIDTTDLPSSSSRQKNDTAFRIERMFWSGNLILFFLSAIAAITMLVMGNIAIALVFAGIMLVSFIRGQRFAVTIPNAHMTEFISALEHREILLMVDLPLSRIAEIEDIVQSHHPEAIVGGVGWTVEALHL